MLKDMAKKLAKLCEQEKDLDLGVKLFVGKDAFVDYGFQEVYDQKQILNAYRESTNEDFDYDDFD